MESIGASRKKMKMPCLPNDSCSEPLESEDGKDVFQGQGYRLTDLERFSLMLSEAHICKEGVKCTWFCVTKLKSSLTSFYVNSQKHSFFYLKMYKFN